MEESSSPPPLPPPSPGEELRTGFASFDATSFFEIQEKERDRKGTSGPFFWSCTLLTVENSNVVTVGGRHLNYSCFIYLFN